MPLIDADSLWKTFENAGWWDNADRDVAQDLLNQAPSVDAEPIRHGRWVKSGYACGESEWTCTVCSNKEWRVSSGRLKWCPFCGAKMDGGKQDATN